MRSLFILTISLFIGFTSVAQEKYVTKSGVIKFAASTENFEPVAATNNTVSAILKSDGTIAVLSLIKGFQFKKKLMQEHFNQPRFMDSEKYPKAKFSGKLVDYKDISGEYKIEGDLTIRGVTKKISSMATVKIVDNVRYLDTKFSVLAADYGISIKSKIAQKIAKQVDIEVNLELK